MIFIEQCSDAIKRLVDENPVLLMTSFDFILENLQKRQWLASFGGLVHHLAFEQKKNWLKMKMEQFKQYKTYKNIDIHVNRGKYVNDTCQNELCTNVEAFHSILQDTCGVISTMDPELLKGKIWVKFNDEAGVGAGQ
jgi:hypothetical protein